MRILKSVFICLFSVKNSCSVLPLWLLVKNKKQKRHSVRFFVQTQGATLTRSELITWPPLHLVRWRVNAKSVSITLLSYTCVLIHLEKSPLKSVKTIEPYFFCIYYSIIIAIFGFLCNSRGHGNRGALDWWWKENISVGNESRHKATQLKFQFWWVWNSPKIKKMISLPIFLFLRILLNMRKHIEDDELFAVTED